MWSPTASVPLSCVWALSFPAAIVPTPWLWLPPAPLVTAFLSQQIGWRAGFALPGPVCLALGLSLPGNGSTLATHTARRALFTEAGRVVMDLAHRYYRDDDDSVLPRNVASRGAFENAMALDIAMGGSTNTVLHTLAIASEGGIEYPLQRLNEVSARVPNICKVSPSSTVHMDDVDRAGGVSAILAELAKKDGILHLDCPTVTQKTLGENIAGAVSKDPEIIRSLNNAYSQTGGLAILFGNIAPEGAVIKAAGVDPDILQHTGTAICFESEEEAMAGILGGKVKEGHVVVIRYEGTKGGPGMKEMLSPPSAIMGMGLGSKFSPITAGRFSGGTRGNCIGHVSPEAAAGGPIALIQNGDTIEIDIPARPLTVKLSQKELDTRRKTLGPPPDRKLTGWLKRYQRVVTSANTGAVLQ